MGSGSADSQFAAYITEQLAPLGRVAAKRFFGGIGIVQDGVLFAMIMDEVLYFRVDAASRPAYEAAGGRPFSYATTKGSRVIAGFFTVPEGLFDESHELCRWARGAIAVAIGAKAKKRPAQRRG